MSAFGLKRIFILRLDHGRSGDSPPFLRAPGQKAPQPQRHGDDGVFNVIKELKQGFH